MSHRTIKEQMRSVTEKPQYMTAPPHLPHFWNNQSMVLSQPSTIIHHLTSQPCGEYLTPKKSPAKIGNMPPLLSSKKPFNDTDIERWHCSSRESCMRLWAIDGSKRAARGLPSQLWSNVDKELRAEPVSTSPSRFWGFGDLFLQWDTQERKRMGLAPRTKEKMEEDLDRWMCEMLQVADDKDRKAKGLGPRSAEDVLKLHREAKSRAFML